MRGADAAAALPHFAGQINPPSAARRNSADPIASLLPKSRASRHSAQKVLSEEAAAADKICCKCTRGAHMIHPVHLRRIAALAALAYAGLCAGHPGRHHGRHAGADAREVHPRLALRGPGRAVHGGARQGLLQSRGSRCHHRHGQRLAQVDPPRRLGHLRHRHRRRELADPLPRREPDHRPQGRHDGLRPAAVRHRRPQEQGHHGRSQEPGRARSSARRPRTAPTPSGRSSSRSTSSTTAP